MQILVRFCLPIAVCSVLQLYKRFLQIFPRFLVMDFASHFKVPVPNTEFACGFLVFGCFSQMFSVLALFLLFVLCLKLLQFSWHSKGLVQFLCEFKGKSMMFRNAFSLYKGFGGPCNSGLISCQSGSLEFLDNSNSQNKGDLVVSKEIFNHNCDVKENEVEEKNNDEKEEEYCGEDEVFDVMALRKLVKFERQRANAACLELEKERMAAASAAEEAMAMILRLQSEKSSIEIQANQDRRLANQKQQYDQEVIQSLQWMVMKHETERILLADKLRLCRQKLRSYTKGDAAAQSDLSDPTLSVPTSTFDDDFVDDVLVGSLEMYSSPL